MKNIYTWAAKPAKRTLTVKDLKNIHKAIAFKDLKNLAADFKTIKSLLSTDDSKKEAVNRIIKTIDNFFVQLEKHGRGSINDKK